MSTASWWWGIFDDAERVKKKERELAALYVLIGNKQNSGSSRSGTCILLDNYSCVPAEFGKIDALDMC
jgi:hypothetical protein